MSSQDQRNTGNKQESSTKRPKYNNFNETNTNQTGEPDYLAPERENTEYETPRTTVDNEVPKPITYDEL